MLAGTAAACLSSTAVAQTAPAVAPAPAAAMAPKPAGPPPPYPGLINSKLRANDPKMKAWDIAVNVRARYDDKDGAGTTDAGSNWDFSERPVDDTHNQYELLRVMPRVGYTAPSWAFLVEGRSSYTFNDDRYSATAPGHNLPEDDGPLDIYQAYVLFGNSKDYPFSLKLGRQELVYGDQRLVGHARWLNVPRTFDAAKVRYENPVFGLDLFASSVVYVENEKINKSNPQDLFYGAYANFPKLAKNTIVEAYLFSRHVTRGIITDDWSHVAPPARFPGPQDLHTLGLRLKSKPGTHGAWDYGFEGMYQFGMRTSVFPGSIGSISYSWKTAWQPKLTVYGSYASGDKSATDLKSQTFQNLFPSNHLLYGMMDLTGLQNAKDLRFSLAAKPKSNLTLTVETNLQWLDRTTDFWYNAGGAPRNFVGAAVGSGGGYRINPSYDTQLGQEVDFIGTWVIKPVAVLELGFGKYFRGDYVKESLRTVGSKNATYGYLQLTLNL
jgi:hypothetical protein